MNTNLIYDVGMFDGADTMRYLKLGYKVVAIEAHPNLVEIAKKRFRKYIRTGQLFIVNCGIAAEEGSMDFFVNEVNPFWNSFDESWAGREGQPYHKIQVPATRFGTILKQYGIPYYLKVDIEGHEVYCIRELCKPDLPRYVSAEASFTGDLEILDRLHALGYSRFQCINMNTHLPIEVPYSPRYPVERMILKDRLYLSIKYSMNFFMRVARKLGSREIFARILRPSRFLLYKAGTSGGFGKELAFPWLDYDSMKERYLASLKAYSEDPSHADYAFWCDLHASL
jgi:FkbM family methyltransferase